MGTLQKSNGSHDFESNASIPAISEKDLKTYRKNEKKLEKEFQRIRGELEEIRQAFRYLEDASSHDDIYFRLLQLEKTTSEVRKGGLLSNGAKQHRKLLRKLNESPIE